jgi:hypothetical protein
MLALIRDILRGDPRLKGPRFLTLVATAAAVALVLAWRWKSWCRFREGDQDDGR